MRRALPATTVTLLVLWGAVLLLLLRAAGGRGVAFYTQDPPYVLGGPWDAGLLSVLGVLGWWTAAAGAALGAAILRRHAPATARMLLSGAALTVLLALDDAFQLHEEAIPDRLGVSQAVVSGLYAVLCLACVAGSRGALRGTPRLVLALAVALLAASMAMDQLAPFVARADDTAVEDGLKLLGIAAWAVFWWSAALGAVRVRLVPAPPRLAAAPPRRGLPDTEPAGVR